MISLKDYEDGFTLEKTAYTEVEKDFQERLYILLGECHKQGIGNIIILEGWGTSGKGELLKTITTRLDPRKFRVYSHDPETDDKRPFLFQFWNKLPRYGETLLLDGSWYSRVGYEKIQKTISKKDYKNSFRSILESEKMLTDDKYLIHKFFLNISSREQKNRLKKARDNNKKWIYTDHDVEQYESYDKYREVYETYLDRTDTSYCPWNIISAKDKNYMKFKVMDTLLKSLEKKLNLDSEKILALMKEEVSVS